MGKIIIVNNGSASKKYSVFEDGKEILFVYLEKVEGKFYSAEVFQNNEKRFELTEDVFDNSFDYLIDRSLELNIIESEDDIARIAIRIVAPGTFFQVHKKIDEKYLEKLDEVKDVSPLHIIPLQDEIGKIRKRMHKIPFYGISDTEFHAGKDREFSTYAIPQDLAKKLEIYRYGYHGISVSSIMTKLSEKNKSFKKIIVCHLGGGSSATAIKDGKSISNSMGYSPVEGLAMASRVGSIDINAMAQIAENFDMDLKDVSDFIYKDCGVKGLSGLSSDTRVLLRESAKGNKNAEFALKYYTTRIKEFIGSYIAILNGIDALILTGTIGERATEVRKRICQDLDCFNLKIDQTKNKMMINKQEGEISEPDSGIKVYVFTTEESKEMARIVSKLN